MALMKIDDMLKKDRQGATRSYLENRFEEKATLVRRALDQGISPNEYQKMVRLLKAFKAANYVTEMLWEKHHKC